MQKRPPQNRRSWLFIPGSDEAKLEHAPEYKADVLIQDLEDFTPHQRRMEARAMCAKTMLRWKKYRSVAAVRINPIADCGLIDLEYVMRGRPDIIMMAMVDCAEQIRALDHEIGRYESLSGIADGSTEVVPNIETAKGLVRLSEIAAASPRVTGLLLAAEDMVANLGAERTPEGRELAYVRSRFLVECVAADVVAIDCPYTFSDRSCLEADIRFARMLGYKAKSVVNAEQVESVNDLLSPSEKEVAHAHNIVEAFEIARLRGLDRAEVDGLMVEVPTYKAAKQLLKRHEDLKR